MSLVYVLKDVRKLFFMEFPVIRKQFYSLEEAYDLHTPSSFLENWFGWDLY